MSVLLKNVIGTSYMIDAISLLFKNTLDSLVNSTEAVDLSGTRFGPRCAAILCDYYDKIKFINTEDPALNELLEHNNKVAENPPEEWEDLNIEDICDVDYLERIKNIPTGKYNIKLDKTHRIHSVLVVLILLSRPDLSLDLSECSALVSDLINNNINIQDFEDEDKCYIVEPPNIMLVDKASVRYDKVIRLPECIGKERIINLDTNKVDARFKNLIFTLSDRLDDYFYPKDMSELDEKSFVNIYDFIELKEE